MKERKRHMMRTTLQCLKKRQQTRRPRVECAPVLHPGKRHPRHAHPNRPAASAAISSKVQATKVRIVVVVIAVRAGGVAATIQSAVAHHTAGNHPCTEPAPHDCAVRTYKPIHRR